mmetsp:Transcript_12161/g.51186  ORF Transcript_12161/g.51186 Transcript_12161/m.51186 type:complete len:352 (-) Transcript_12161:285-1340(-)
MQMPSAPGATRRRTSPVAALTSYRHSSVAGMLRKSGERLEPPSSKEKGSAEPHSPRNEPGASSSHPAEYAVAHWVGSAPGSTVAAPGPVAGPSCANAVWISKLRVGPSATRAGSAGSRGTTCSRTGRSGREMRHSPAPRRPATKASGERSMRFCTKTYAPAVTPKSCGAVWQSSSSASRVERRFHSLSHSKRRMRILDWPGTLCHAHPQSLSVCGSMCGCAVNAHPPTPSFLSSSAGSTPVETNALPALSPSSPPSVSPCGVRHSSVSGSSSHGSPASYRLSSLPPHATTCVLERFLVARSKALAATPPGLGVPKVPRYLTASAVSSSAYSAVRTNRPLRLADRAPSSDTR